MSTNDTPTPIDPADIRAGDVVEIVTRVTVARAEHGAINGTAGDDVERAWWVDIPDRTYRLVHRPDPDAWAVQMIRSASYNIWLGEERLDPLPGLRESAELLNRLREQGGDVVRREATR